MTQPNIYVLEGGASNQVQRIIGQNFFLKSDISCIRPFETSEAMRNFKYTLCYFKVVTLLINNLF
jgi:hypothetical protein